MKQTAIAIALMTLVLIGTTLAQPQRRVAGSTAMGGGSGVGVKNGQPANFRKRIDKSSPVTNLGDTGTHEVGHKGTRRNAQSRPTPGGDGTTEHFRKQPNAAKYGDIDGESKVARTETVNSNESKSKRTRQRSTQKRQHLPCKAGDCK